MEDRVAQALGLPLEEVRRWPHGCVQVLHKVIEDRGWLA